VGRRTAARSARTIRPARPRPRSKTRAARRAASRGSAGWAVPVRRTGWVGWRPQMTFPALGEQGERWGPKGW